MVVHLVILLDLELDFALCLVDFVHAYVVPSQVIHPDKTPHARAPDAFDLLKKVRLSPFHDAFFISYEFVPVSSLTSVTHNTYTPTEV